jgi:hypothetical protein
VDMPHGKAAKVQEVCKRVGMKLLVELENARVSEIEGMKLPMVFSKEITGDHRLWESTKVTATRTRRGQEVKTRQCGGRGAK